MRIVAGAEAGFDISEDARRAAEIRLLRQIAHGRARLDERVPRSGSTSPAVILSRVDLPEPLRPTRHTRSPAETDNSTPVSSGVPPKVSAISLSWTSGGAMGQSPARRRCARRIA